MVKTETDKQEETMWRFHVDEYIFSTDTLENTKKSMAFARILGYFVTDGCLSKNRKYPHAVLCMGHIIDVRSIQKDLQLVFGTSGTCKFRKGLYIINLGVKIANFLAKIDGITPEKRIIQSTSLPTFIKTAPRIIIANFLAGLFGGDGVAPSSKIQPSGIVMLRYNISFVFSKVENENESAIEYQNDFIKLLNKFHIEGKIKQKSRPIKKDGLQKYKHIIFIRINDLQKFYKNIGFAYCTTKHIRLAVTNSLINLRNCIKQQNDEISDIFNKISNYQQLDKDAIKLDHTDTNKGTYISKQMKMTMDDTRKESIKIWNNNNPIYGHIKSASSIRNELVGKTKNTVVFVNDGEILKKWNAYKYFREDKNESGKINFDTQEQMTNSENKENKTSIKHTKTAYVVSQERNTIPCMKMKVLYKRNIGMVETYDISVDKTHNFVANGVVVHNCKFACLLYSLIVNRLNKEIVYDIVHEAVSISKLFNKDAIKCQLIGMNIDLMYQYIEYVADILLVMLGYEKIYNTTNPFEFMESIGLDNKTSFFESRPTEYQSAYNTKNIAKKRILLLDDF